ncbi:toll/interleukin-1 receptor domain-containing protein [Luteimonas vadosa]|uniref:TIR domain-containing protein n=1 Tax=Luteimonas vadosa TaxID=1165507 RepID=A0ABP9DZX2_9GAMM
MRYRAFISYSHADEAWATWLFKRLETYRVPPRLVGRQTGQGKIGARLGAFFRDRDELTAASDLSATIQDALAESDALIVICSPAAAASRWVNAEVEAFRASGRGERIYAFVVGGEPGCIDDGGCFPPALTAPGEDGQPVEPLAADARPEGDGRKRAFLKLVAGLLGVGFDQLAQREAQRKQRRLVQVAVASLAGMTLAIGLAVTAHVARNDAQRRQAQAEDILGFMLGDLREKLTTVGRLDLMRTVDDKATVYFATLDPRDLSDRTLEEQARSLTGIGQVRLDEGNHDEATAAFREAHARSTALQARDPGNGQRLFDLAQAEFWLGFVAFQQGKYGAADAWLRKYHDSAMRVAAMDRGNFAWQKEQAYALHNLAVMDEQRGRYVQAERSMRAAISLYRDWIGQRPGDLPLRSEAADAMSWLGTLALARGQLDSAEDYFAEQVDVLQRNAAEEPDNAVWRDYLVRARLLLVDALAQRGKLEDARSLTATTLPVAAALAAQDPANNAWRTWLGACHWWRSRLATDDAAPLAEEEAAQAERIFVAALAAEPEKERLVVWLARTRHLRAQLALGRGDLRAARGHVAGALALIEPAWRARQNEDLRLWLARTRLLQGDIDASSGNRADGVRSWTEATHLLEQPDRRGPVPFLRLEPLLRAQVALGAQEKAVATRRRLDAAGYVPLHPFADIAPVAAR